MTKEVALADAKNQLSALVQEVEDTGAEIVITKHGRPVARISAARQKSVRSVEERRAALRLVLARTEHIGREHPASAEPMSWEELKRLMRNDDKWDELLK
jgi:prevent-host-death family protein